MNLQHITENDTSQLMVVKTLEGNYASAVAKLLLKMLHIECQQKIEHNPGFLSRHGYESVEEYFSYYIQEGHVEQAAEMFKDKLIAALNHQITNNK